MHTFFNKNKEYFFICKNIGRYISTSEAVWRILELPIHERHPTVVQLDVHLENGQRVYFSPNDDPQRILSQPPRSTLLSFFDLC